MITPDFVGQRYKDTSTGTLWIANSTTPGDWSVEYLGPYDLLGSGDGIHIFRITSPINMDIDWVKSVDGFTFETSGNSCTDLTFSKLISVGGVDVTKLWIDVEPNLVNLSLPVFTTVGEKALVLIESNPNMVSVDMPLLASMTGTATGAAITIQDCATLATVNLPLFETFTALDYFKIYNCGITSIAFPSLASAGGATAGFEIRACAALTSLSVPNFLPVNGTLIDLRLNALDATSVNHVLARAVASVGFVTGQILLTGGTNSAPSGQGAIDKTTLIGRGVTVQTN